MISCRCPLSRATTRQMQVARPGRPERLEHLRDAVERRDRLVEPALRRSRGRRRRAPGSRSAPGSTPGRSCGSRRAPSSLRQPRLHRPARDAELAGDLDQPDARIDRQILQDARVEPVQTGHIDQSSTNRTCHVDRCSGTLTGMFEEGQLYSPVTEDEDGTVTVHLAPSHPGVDDPVYLRAPRRDRPRRAATGRPGTPAPDDRLHRAEHEVWRTVCRELDGQAPRARALRLPRGVGRRGAADRPRAAARRGLRARRRPHRLHLRPRPRPRPAARSSTARSPTASSTPRSTCATRASRSTRPSRTSSTRSSATASRSPRRRSPSCTG